MTIDDWVGVNDALDTTSENRWCRFITFEFVKLGILRYRPGGYWEELHKISGTREVFDKNNIDNN